ncbi:MFS transporter [Ralstonia solanacearum]|uniref:MFS transporter n=1 Tax=Ralstonia solanacearum TaxID=305 RepID=UPI0022B0F827|nr:MFS transporter [Ralstonia solanacearum]
MPIGWALGLDVATALLGIAPLLCCRIPQACTPNGRPTGLWPAFREGVELVWKTPGLRWLYILLGAVVLAIMPTFTLVPLLVKTHFGGGAAQVALMEGLSGIGMVAGGLLVAAMAPRRQVSWVLCGFAVSCVALAPGSLFGVAVAWWVISGITFVFGNAPLTALLQTRVPNHLQGRVLSLRNTTMGLAAPVGLALFTPLGEVIGVRALFAITGLLGAVASLAGFLSPSLMRLDRQGSRTEDRTD